MSALTVLAPLLALHRAMAASDDPRVQSAHDAMDDLPEMKMHGDEHVAMLIYPGFTALDLVGPHYFFASMMGATVHLVAKSPDRAPIASDLGLAIAPTTSFAECPKDVTAIFAPGGTQGTVNAMMDDETVAFVADRASRAQFITSVCTGALILGQAGLLNGKRATSHWAARDSLPLFGAKPVNQRVVTDGNVITAAGVSAGLDLGLAIVAKLRGRRYAQALRLQAEYAPKPPVPGGTLETTEPQIAKLMKDMLAPFGGMVAKAAQTRRT
ncbi:MAG: DJ-1/PfpI family protein [Alphaproteobacteria bacterium]|nr:DJ-1/PfpI family protein [Alphaproteobacteria bacterium]